MGKYFALWEVDQNKIPIDRKERGIGWAFLMSMVRKDIEKGITKDWGHLSERARVMLFLKVPSWM